MHVSGITWHAITLPDAAFEETRDLLTRAFGLTAAVESEGFAMFNTGAGGMLEIYTPSTTPAYGFNGGAAFGFRVDDLASAVATLLEAGYEPLSAIVRLEEIHYSYVHFRGPNGIVYGLNQQD